jgi:hypothetical protein
MDASPRRCPSLCGRLRAYRRSGADLLSGYRPADDNNNEYCPAVGIAPLLTLGRQK